ESWVDDAVERGARLLTGGKRDGASYAPTVLERVRGLTLKELPGAEECCGFGGTFAVKNPAVSAAMGADKVRAVAGTGAEALCTVDNSCLLHLGGMLVRQGSPVRPVHLAEILASTEADVAAGGGPGRAAGAAGGAR
ncbi:heterodisulfide reductase-related iron-sulfur binding cluster, partial [Streptomyces sp. NPDC001793]|uniref:heterodisulfide reductase-related iron-sulfur binding cluster n=1 Tax=Streptomyces sp. NPDC001793 TaxID=3154657 RepID=UPI003330D157